jgi:hypothetical protein
LNLPHPPLLFCTRDAPPDADLTPPVVDLVDVIGADGCIAWSNEVEAAALGFADGALEGVGIYTVYERASADWILAASRHPQPAGTAVSELVMLRKDGARLRTLGRVLGPPAADGSLTLAKTPLGALAARLDRLEAENRLLRQIADTGKEAHWCIEFAEPVDISLPEDEVVFRIFTHPSYWRLCNQAMSRLYGLPHHVDLSEQSVRLYWPRSAPNEAFVRQIIASGYCIDGAVSVDHRHDGALLTVENDVRADIEHGRLVRLWGNCRAIGTRHPDAAP